MKIVGCDLHTRYQQVAMLDTETGELVSVALEHANGEARAFYALAGGPGDRPPTRTKPQKGAPFKDAKRP